MKRLLLAVMAIAMSSPAFAAHCRHGMIYRVSMGECVSKHSRLAHGFVRARTRHERVARVARVTTVPKTYRERAPFFPVLNDDWYVNALIPAEKADAAISRPVDEGDETPDWKKFR